MIFNCLYSSNEKEYFNSKILDYINKNKIETLSFDNYIRQEQLNGFEHVSFLSLHLDKCNKIDCDRFCQRYFKMNFYYDEALIDLNQRHHIKLLLDQDERDRQSFERLSLIEKNIVDYVKSGNNLLIYSKT